MMMPTGRFHQDQSGTKLNMLTLIEKTNDKAKNGSYRYRVKCDCGTETVGTYNLMRSGRMKSCGCLSLRKGKDSPNFKHGLSKTKEYENELFLKRTYGLSKDEFDAMLAEQNGKCAICKAEAPAHHKKRLNVDHCHTTGMIRGLLCDACNRGLGLFKDNPELLHKAIQYLSIFQNALAR
jgi:hypothetical protein